MIGTLAYQTVNREVLVLAGGPRALLMQLAMPGVAAAVDEWSDFRRRPVRRLWRTLTLSYGLAFGAANGDDARLSRAAAAINRAHAPVAGEGYSARDPRLLLWVHATLVDSALVAYSAFVRPLTAAEREDYYQASMTTAPLLGLPSSMFPPSYPEFVDYVTTALATACVVDARARALAARVLAPVGWFPSAAWAPVVEVTSALLPGSLRRAYELPEPGGAWRWSAEWLPRLRRVAPRVLWEMPAARR
jgi:uncharacterized protein (DUF2236 family)